MTPNELQERLDQLSNAEFDELTQNFGGIGNRDHLLSDFVHHPERERLLAHLLEMPTEEEKRTRSLMISAGASSESAEAAKSSADSAKVSVIWAAVSAAVATGSMLVVLLK
jgi:hypothetical protein